MKINGEETRCWIYKEQPKFVQRSRSRNLYNEYMKMVLDWKKGWFGRIRELKIYFNGDVHLIGVKQGEQVAVEIIEDVEFMCGKKDWAKTEKIKIEDLSDGDHIEIIPFFTLNPFKMLGLNALPMRFAIKNKDI